MRVSAALLPVLCSVALSSTAQNSGAPGAVGTGIGLWLNIVAERPRAAAGLAAGPLVPVQLPLNIGGVEGISLPVLLLAVPYPQGACAASPAPPAPRATPAPRRHAHTYPETGSPEPAPARLHSVHAKYTVKDDTMDEQPQPDPPSLPPPSSGRLPLQTSPEMINLATENAGRVPWVFSPSPFFPDGKLPFSIAMSHVHEAKAQEYISFEQRPALANEPARGNEDKVTWVFSPSPFERRDKESVSVAVDTPTEPTTAAEHAPELPMAVNYLKENEDGPFRPFRGFGSIPPAPSASTPAAPQPSPVGYI